MYLFINDKGHVETGSIDSYHKEEFQGRFYFILGKIGEEYLSESQKTNIRRNHYLHVKLNAPYELAKYNEESKQGFKDWVGATLKHILTCEFKDLVDYPDPPTQDNPTGEIKMTITEYEIDNK